MKQFLFALFLLGAVHSTYAQAAKNLSLVSHVTFSATLNDVWGYEDGNGNEYALVGRTDGVSIVDLSNPALPVEIQFISGAGSTWRDLKTYGTFAYVSNETADGLLIIDLSNLPGTVSAKDTVIAGVETIHNLWVGGDYLYAAGIGPGYTGGLMMLDLQTDPWRPALAGIYDNRYVHDIYTRGDTAYSADINDGLITILDVSDKSAIAELGSRSYLNSFTHNTWLNDAGDVCFTTDELTAAYVYAWDVSDPTDIRQLDRIRSSLSNGGATPHNVHVLNDYLITSYYKDGIQIVDASRPTNLVETGYYDTNPDVGGGTSGCWGAYPYLNSGLILATDQTEGLFVLQPTYTQGCYLEGTVTDATTNALLSDVRVSLTALNMTETTDMLGDYATGVADAGSYMVTYEKFGYVSETRTVSLTNGAIIIEDVALSLAATSSFDIIVVDAQTNQPIPDAQVLAYPPGNAPTFNYTTNPSGLANEGAMVASNYSIAAGKWGYVTQEISVAVSASTPSVTIELEPGYYDDFTFDFGWQVFGNASDGAWERGEPNGTTVNGFFEANPDEDIDTDIWQNAWVTGNGGEFFLDDDLDGGLTSILSPIFDLSTYVDPRLDFHWWLVNFQGGSGDPTNDNFVIEISNNGSNFVEVSRFNQRFNFLWTKEEIRILDYVSLSNTMFLKVSMTDDAPDDIVEAAFDGFEIVETANTGLEEEWFDALSFNLYPVPVSDVLTIDYALSGSVLKGNMYLEIYDLRGVLLATHALDGLSNIQTVSFPFSAGMYMAVLKQEDKTLAVKKLVK